MSVHLPTGTKLAGGRYSVGKTLGQGGFGITYLGADTTLGRSVALKELFPDGSTRQGFRIIPPHSLGAKGFTEAKEAFLNEARMVAQFMSPGVVRVFDVFEENNTAYMVMEFLQGKTLGKRIEEGNLSPAEIESIAIKVAEALQTVHAAGLLHRDIKPDNLYLAQDGRVVLIDFGSARGFAEGKTVSHTRLITPGYAPLEQYATAAKLGPYTDIYALGATLFHALTGHPPPAAADRMVGIALPDLPANTPPNLANAVLRAMEVRIEQRPANLQAFLQLLQSPSPSPTATVAPSPSATPTAAPPSTPTPNRPSPPIPTPPKPVPPAPKSSGLRVSSVEELIQQAKQGGRIELLPGTYTLTQTLVLAGDVELVGQSRDQVFLHGLDRAVLRYTGGGSFKARSLSFVQKGASMGDGVVVEAGNIELVNCRFSEGKAGEKSGRLYGFGLVINGQVRGLVEGCESLSNQQSGIIVMGQAEVRLENNLLKGNQQYGMVFSQEARGSAARNTAQDNTLGGVVIAGTAQPALSHNTLRRNGGSGIAYLEQAGGSADNNRIEDNTLHGIEVQDHAQPTLQNNTIRRNQQYGLVYAEHSKGRASQNTIEDNLHSGIVLLGRVKPTLEDNTLRRNLHAGIEYTEHAVGLARRNTCEANLREGIKVVDSAHPTLEGNLIRNNVANGLLIAGSSRVLARQNILEHNGLSGIMVTGQAQPTLQNNTARKHPQCGLVFTQQASGNASGNLAEDNEQDGIMLAENANVTLEGNTAKGNRGSGIAVYGQAKGNLKRNQMLQNEGYGMLLQSSQTPLLEANMLDSNRQGNANVPWWRTLFP